MKTLNFDNVQTVSGKKVRILCTDSPGYYPVVGLVDGNSVPNTWSIEGETYRDKKTPNDLVEVPVNIPFLAGTHLLGKTLIHKRNRSGGIITAVFRGGYGEIKFRISGGEYSEQDLMDTWHLLEGEELREIYL